MYVVVIFSIFCFVVAHLCPALFEFRPLDPPTVSLSVCLSFVFSAFVFFAMFLNFNPTNKYINGCFHVVTFRA